MAGLQLNRFKRVMTQKGFTLIELMATLMILGLILAIAVPAVGNITEKAEAQAKNASIAMIENAAALASMSDHPMDSDIPVGNGYHVSTLVRDGFLKLPADSPFAEAGNHVVEESPDVFRFMGGGESLPSSPVTDFNYTVLADSVVITEYLGDRSDVVIPNLIEGKPVTMLDEQSFAGRNLTSVRLPNTLKEIGADVFMVNELSHIDLPNGLESIGSGAFESNSLTKLAIPKSVTHIGSGAFSANQLTIAYFPEWMTEIPKSLYYENNITSVVIPERVTSIGDNAFGKNKLTSVSIPNGVTMIGSFAFSFNQLTEVKLPSNLTVLSTGVLQSNQLTRLDIPASVTKIQERVTIDNPNLRDVFVVNPAAVYPEKVSTAFDYVFLSATANQSTLTVHAPRGSTSETVATRFGYKFVSTNP